MDFDSPQRFEFGGFRLDRRRRELRNADGVLVDVSAKAFDALVCFLEHPGRLVTRAELMAALWPGLVVEENTLSRVIVLLRRALGDGFVVTVKGRGYQLVNDVHAVPDDSVTDRGYASSAASNRAHADHKRAPRVAAGWALGAALLGLAAVSGYVSVAPEERAPDPVKRYIATPTQNARALDFYERARDYEWYTDDPALALQQYRRAVEEDPEFALAWARISIRHIEDYWFRDHRDERRQDAFDTAQRALAIQPDLAEAHMALGWVYHHGFLNYEAALQELMIAARRMPGDSEIHWRIGNVYRRWGRLDEALEAYERAAALQPRDPVWLLEVAETHVLRREYGQADREFDEIRTLVPDHFPSMIWRVLIPLYSNGDVTALKAAAADPRFDSDNPWRRPRPVLGWMAALYERDFNAALSFLDNWQDDAWSDWQYLPKASAYGVARELAGQHEAARRDFERARTQVVGALATNADDPTLLMALGEVLARLGDPDAARHAARQAIQIFEDRRDAINAPIQRLDAVLRVLIPIGDFGAALDELDRYLSAPGVWSVEGLLLDPRLDPIRDDSRVLALIERHARSSTTRDVRAAEAPAREQLAELRR
jgi:DNA-binding winged helix-turn-helix (wHTH) protein/Flp pilus assembly protein TadD